MHDVDRQLPRAGPGARPRRACSGSRVVAPHGGRAPRLDVRSLCLARELLAYQDGLADFAFAMQGLGSGPISLFGSEAAEGALPAAGGRRPRDLRLRADRARRGLRCQPDRDQRAARGRCLRARRRQDLDLERRHRRPLRGVRPHRRGAGRQGHLGAGGRGRHARPRGRRAARGDGAASAGDAPLRGRPRAGSEPARRRRRRLQDRDGDARRVPRRRSARRRWASPAARSTRRSITPSGARSWAGRWPSCR